MVVMIGTAAGNQGEGIFCFRGFTRFLVPGNGEVPFAPCKIVFVQEFGAGMLAVPAWPLQAMVFGKTIIMHAAIDGSE